MSEELALAEWARAQESMGPARLCHNAGFYGDAVSRAYYSVLHAAKAALQLNGVTTMTHAGIKKLFGLHVVMAGLVERGWGEEIGPLRALRMLADYDVTTIFSETNSGETCERAEAFVNRIRVLLATAIPTGNFEAGSG